MHNPERNYDVVIAGGGVVGATLACALGDAPLRVAVVEPRAPLMDWPADSRDLRVSAVTAGSVRIFETLGVWPGMLARRVSAFREMHVWDARAPGVIHFDSADIGTATLGYIVENRVMQAALYDRMRTFANIDWIGATRLHALREDAAHLTLETEDGQTLRARLLVGADGADSAVRRLAGIGTHGWAHCQTAIVANVKTAHGHQETAWQRFLPEGPLAFLPLTDGYSSIVWTVTPEHAAQLLALNDAAFLDELNTALLGPDLQIPGVARGLGALQHVAGARAGFALRLIHADTYVCPRVALIGDAAHTVHPLAGQGVNLGLCDAAALAQVLSEAHARHADIGSLATLRRYQRWRKGDNVLMAAGLEGIRHLFGPRPAPLRWARGLGLNLVNAAHPLKNAIMRYAMGLTGDLPKLARGVPLAPPDERPAYAQRTF